MARRAAAKLFRTAVAPALGPEASWLGVAPSTSTAAAGSQLGQLDRAWLGSAASLPAQKDGKVMHPDLLNENLKKTQYAVRGELYLRGEELRRAGKEIIFTNGALF